MKPVRLIPLLLLLMDACIQPLDLKEIPSEPALVVSGMITDKPGPYKVTLAMSLPVASDLDRQAKVSGATITLYDDAGNSEQMTEVSEGTYQTSATGIRGTVGRRYHIRISLNGKEYVSRETQMFPAGTIEEVFAEFEQNVINHHDIGLPQHAVRIYVNSRGEPGNPNLFRWRWSGVFEVNTYPQLRVAFPPNSPTPIPDPMPCSGYIWNGFVLQPVNPCECCQCWVEEFGDAIQISNNQFVESTNFNKVLVHTFPFTISRFFYRYRIVVEQLSLDEETYDFWRLVDAQYRSSGDIFQPNSIRIKGNVTCVSDPNERVMGIFAASAITEQAYFIPRKIITVPMYPDSIIEDCRVAYLRSSNVRPPFW